MSTRFSTDGNQPINQSDAFCAFSETTQATLDSFNQHRDNNPHSMTFMSARPFCVVGKLISFSDQVAEQIRINNRNLGHEEFSAYLEKLFSGTEGNPVLMSST